MTNGTVLVASPSAIGSAPEASGSSVPAWPARLAVNSRLMTLTAWVEVMPTGLSSATQPCTSRLSRLNCCLRGRGACAPSPACGEVSAFAGWLGLFIVVLQIAHHRRRAQQLVDPLGFGETLVDAEADVGREFQVDALGDLDAQKFLVALEGGDHLLGVAPAHRHDVDGGEPQVGAHAHLRHGNEMTLDDRIVHVAAREHLGHGVAHQFANAQLALRAAAGWCAVAFLFVAHNKSKNELSWPGLSRPSRLGRHSRAVLIGMPGTSPGMTVEMAE